MKLKQSNEAVAAHVRVQGKIWKFDELPEHRPYITPGTKLYAVLAGRDWEKAYDVSNRTDYAVMYAQATTSGCQYSVSLYANNRRSMKALYHTIAEQFLTTCRGLQVVSRRQWQRLTPRRLVDPL